MGAVVHHEPAGRGPRGRRGRQGPRNKPQVGTGWMRARRQGRTTPCANLRRRQGRTTPCANVRRRRAAGPAGAQAGTDHPVCKRLRAAATLRTAAASKAALYPMQARRQGRTTPYANGSEQRDVEGGIDPMRARRQGRTTPCANGSRQRLRSAGTQAGTDHPVCKRLCADVTSRTAEAKARRQGRTTPCANGPERR